MRERGELRKAAHLASWSEDNRGRFPPRQVHPHAAGDRLPFGEGAVEIEFVGKRTESSGA